MSMRCCSSLTAHRHAMPLPVPGAGADEPTSKRASRSARAAQVDDDGITADDVSRKQEPDDATPVGGWEDPSIVRIPFASGIDPYVDTSCQVSCTPCPLPRPPPLGPLL